MTVETDLVAVLQLQCPRVYADTVPAKTLRPYVRWQRIGGESIRFVDNTASELRNVDVQIDVWCDTRLQADALALEIEDALCAAAAFIAEPQAESDALSEPDVSLYGASQDFSIWGNR